MPTIWPPQDTGLFEFKQPCCQCGSFPLFSWGDNTDGELGLGDTTDRDIPVQVGTSTFWVEVGLGNDHSHAVTSLGTLWSWGNNTFGGLGFGTTGGTHNTPTQVGSLTTWSRVAGGGGNTAIGFTLAIQTDGTLWACGLNSSGQLGIGSTTNQSSFTQVGTDTDWVAVTAGSAHSLAIKSDGTLWAWGNNGNGQLGFGTTGGTHNSPVQVGVATDWAQVVATGSDSTIALKTDGTLWSWGNNTNGQLGLGTTGGTHSSPTQVGAVTTWVGISIGDFNNAFAHTLALKADGTLWACGNNSFGQLGIGSTTAQNTLTQIGALTTWAKVSCGGGHTLAIQTDGTLWSWGRNNSGELGLGSTGGTHTSPTQVGTGTWLEVFGGGLFSMGIV